MILANIRLVPDKYKYEDVMGRLDKKAFRLAANELTKSAGHEVAEDALKRLHYILKPGGTADVGATGGASKNFEVQMVDVGNGIIKWQIIEGGATPANAYIREGIPPGYKADRMTLFGWAKIRGIELVHPREYHQEGPPTGKAIVQKLVEPGTGKSRKGNIYKRKGYIRSKYTAKANPKFTPKQITSAALSAMARVLQKYGTERPKANWFPKYPSGQGRFDYVVYNFMRHKNYYEQSTVRAAGILSGGIIEYLGSGRIRRRGGTLKTVTA